MKRRTLLSGLAIGGAAAGVMYAMPFSRVAVSKDADNYGGDTDLRDKYMAVTEDEWKQRLTPMQYYVMREEGTEKPGSSPLNDEKRAGTFQCVACGNVLFSSEKKYDSKTGWPSFYDALPDAVDTKRDYKMVLPRTEYHCARCGSHHGHIFSDGPEPTGLRYCNNGVALKFVPTA